MAARNKKRGHCSHRNPFLSLKLFLLLNLIRFWYQAFFSYASLPLQHAWNCTALSIIYSLSFAYCFLWMPWFGHLQLCCMWYDALLYLPHCSDPPPLQVWAQLICWRWMGSYGFFPSFTQWQHGEVLWGLGANELTLQCWGRCSVTQGESEDGAGGDALESQRGHYMTVPDMELEGLNRTSQNIRLSPKSAIQPNWTHHLEWHHQMAFLTQFLPLLSITFLLISRNCSQWGCRGKKGNLLDQPLHQLHRGMDHNHNHISAPMERIKNKWCIYYTLCIYRSISSWIVNHLCDEKYIYKTQVKKIHIQFWVLDTGSVLLAAFPRPACIQHVAKGTYFMWNSCIYEISPL